jgi:choline dehydrogenase-like flavoprotein
VKNGRCEVRAECTGRRIILDDRGRASEVEYHDKTGKVLRVSAKIVVVACQPVETTRLLLMSSSSRFPNGLANNSGQVGKNLIFAAGSSAEGAFPYDKFSPAQVEELRAPQTFINRTVHDWYTIDDRSFGPRCKGGSLDFMFVHPNPISLAHYFAFSNDPKMVWGRRFKNDLKHYINDGRHVMVEIFADWMPNDNCFVSLDSEVKDRWGLPVAKVRMNTHRRQPEIGRYLADRAVEVLRAMGAYELESSGSGGPATNLPAGTCRFGKDPKTSVLDPDCRAHEVENLFVSDGSFMPTGGSVPQTWTVYANSFRVADKIISQLGGRRGSPSAA